MKEDWKPCQLTHHPSPRRELCQAVTSAHNQTFLRQTSRIALNVNEVESLDRKIHVGIMQLASSAKQFYEEAMGLMMVQNVRVTVADVPSVRSE